MVDMDEQNLQKTERSSNREEPKYWCFISCRQAANTEPDRQWAQWLQRAIKQYDVPADLIDTVNSRGELIPERISTVLPDENNSVEQTKELLKQSRCLVVICSPEAANSRNVNDAISTFVDPERPARIVPAIIAGQPGNPEQECIPGPLRKDNDEEGETAVDAERLTADFRLPDGSEGFTSPEVYRLKLRSPGSRAVGEKADAYESQLQAMKLKVIAGILGVSPQTLLNRDKAYQLIQEKERASALQLWLTITGVVTITSFIGALMAVGQRDSAVVAKSTAEAERKKAENTIKLMTFELRENLPPAVPGDVRERILEGIEGHNSIAAQKGEAASDAVLASQYTSMGNQSLALGDLDTAFQHFLKSQNLIQHLAELEPTRSDFKRDLSTNFVKLGDIKVKTGQSAPAINYYREALSLQEQLVSLNSDNIQFRLDLSTIYNKLGSAVLKEGKTDEAFEAFDEYTRIGKELVKLHPDNARCLRHFAISNRFMGDLKLQQGESENALKYYNNWATSASNAANLDPDNWEYWRDLTLAYNKQGDINQKLGKLQAALTNYSEGLEVRERMKKLCTRNEMRRWDVSASHEKLAEVKMKLGLTGEAYLHLEQSNMVLEEMAKLAPDNVRIRRDLAISKGKLGDVELQLGKSELALNRMKQSTGILEELAQGATGPPEARIDLIHSYNMLGNAKLRLGQTEDSLKLFNKALAEKQKLVQLYPKDLDYQRGLAMIHCKLGEVRFNLLDDSVVALGHFNDSLKILEDVVEQNPSNDGFRRDLWVLNYKLGETYEKTSAPGKALKCYQQSLAHIQEVRKLDGLSIFDQEWQRKANAKLKTLGTNSGKADLR